MKFNKKYLIPFILVCAGLAATVLNAGIDVLSNLFSSANVIGKNSFDLATPALVALTLAFVFFKDSNKKLYPIFLMISLGLHAVSYCISCLAEIVNWIDSAIQLGSQIRDMWFNYLFYILHNGGLCAMFVIIFFMYLKGFKNQKEEKIHKLLPIIAFGVTALVAVINSFTDFVSLFGLLKYADIAFMRVLSMLNLNASAAIAVGSGLFFLLSDYLIVDPKDDIIEA